MTPVIVGIGALTFVYAILAVIGWRRPLLARLAWREATRRPGQSVLLVFGMMFGTAAILGMQGVADTIVNGADNGIYSQWGRVDITVSSNGQTFSSDVARALQSDPQISAKAAGVQGGLDLGGSAADLDRRLSASPVQVIGFDTGQPGLGTFTLSDGTNTDGRSLSADQVILSPALGQRLEARQGDHIRIQLELAGQIQHLDATVAGIASQAGSGGYGLQPGIFVPLSAFASLGLADAINVVRISARGDGQAEVDNAHQFAPAVQTVVSNMPGSARLVVREVKLEDTARLNNSALPERVGIGSLSLIVVLAATALVINLVLALAEERRPRLAVMRAIGLTRTGLVTVAVLEGALYALAAGLLGIIPGVAYTYVVDNRPAPSTVLVATGGNNFTISAGTVVVSVCLGVLITLITILFASLRTSRIGISSAIRNMPELGRQSKRSWTRTAGQIALALLGAAALLPGDVSLRLIGGAALVVAMTMLVRRRVSERARATIAGVAVVTWVLAALMTTRGSGAVLPSVVGLVLIVFGGSTVLAANLRLLERGSRFLSANLAATLRPTLGYMTRRPIRSGLATGSFALVLAFLVFLAVFVPTSRLQATAVTSGYDVRVTALGTESFVMPSDMQDRVSHVMTLKTRSYIGEARDDTGPSTSTWYSTFVQLYPLSDAQLADPPVKMVMRDRRYASDAAAWQAVKDNPGLVIQSAGGTNGSTLLGHVWLKTGTADAEFTIIGEVPGGVLSGYIGSEGTFTAIPTAGTGTTVLLGLVPGVDAHLFARQLRQETFGQVVDASATQDLVNAFNA